MTSEKMMEMIMMVYDRLDMEEKKNADYYLKNLATGMSISFKDSTFTGASLGCTVGEIIRVLKQDIYNSENKKSGKFKQANVIKSVIGISKHNAGKPQWHTTYIIDGKQYVMCGYYAFVFNDPVAGVPVSHEEMYETEIANMYNTSKLNTYDTELELPERTALSAYIKTQKAQRKTISKYAKKDPITFDFGGNFPIVNAEYLLDVMDGLPDGKLMFNSNHPYAPMLCESSAGEGLLLPMRKKHENTNRTEL